ncbi:hypothetical protein M758_4G127300 [Ceratodon purpureus]|nr:hypothetical protein M758_4G127300 [Ceratodon purpureus]
MMRVRHLLFVVFCANIIFLSPTAGGCNGRLVVGAKLSRSSPSHTLLNAAACCCPAHCSALLCSATLFVCLFVCVRSGCILTSKLRESSSQVSGEI